MNMENKDLEDPLFINEQQKLETKVSPNYSCPVTDHDHSEARCFTCKICKQLYEIPCRSNLIIRGFCESCLHETQEKGGLHFASVHNDVNSIRTSQDSVSPVSDRLTEAVDVFTPHVATLIDCPFCSDSFRLNKALNEHLKIRFSGKYSCKLCGKLFCKPFDLKEHEIVHEEISNRSNDLEVNVEKISSVQNELVEFKKVIEGNNLFVKYGAPEQGVKDFKESDIVASVADDNVDCKGNLRKYSGSMSKYCELCNSRVQESEFIIHMKVHEESMEFSAIRTRRKSSLSLDIKSVKELGTKKPESNVIYKYNYKCDLCKENFENLISLDNHINSDEHANQLVVIVGINLVCKQCDNTFTNINELKTHLTVREHILKHHIHLSNVKLYDCSTCNMSFINKFDFDVHEYIDHCSKNLFLENNNKISMELQVPAVKVVRIDGKPEKIMEAINDNSLNKSIVKPLQLWYSCLSCAKSFQSVVSLKKHGTYYRHKIDLTGKMLNSKNVVRLFNRRNNACLNAASSKKYSCQHCNKHFKFNCRLKKHLIMCQQKKIDMSSTVENGTTSSHEFMCESKCLKTFNSLSDFVCHKLTEYHKLSKPYICVYCMHCKTSHSGLFSFMSHCKHSSHILQHAPEAVDNKAFCKTCNCSISVSKLQHVQSNSHIGRFAKFLIDNSYSHTDLAKLNEIVQAKESEINGEKGNSTNASQPPLTCSICWKTFYSKLGLKRHMQKHGIAQSHTCSICKRRCSNSTKLKLHMKYNHEERRFPCNKCEKKFPYFYLLKLHEKSRHK